MSDLHKQIINVSVTIYAPVHVVWESWTEPQHVTKWNQASDDWHTPSGTNDLVPGGRFNYRMEAKDGSMGFDFEGTYDLIEREKRIEYTMDDDRHVTIIFESDGNQTHVSEAFDADSTYPIELQQGGWQAILDNFKKYAEAR